MKFVGIVVLASALSSLCFVDSVEARGHRRIVYSKHYRFGGARPVTGYGANIHRNFVLKQEARRASYGKRVRNRGNVLWYR